MDGFMEALAAAQASQDAYVATLPLWVQLWMKWMTAVLGLGTLVFSFVRAEARWLLLAMIAALASSMAIGMSVGWNKLWGAAHLVFWTPVVVYYIRRWPHVEKKSIFGVWFVMALATMIVSLVFDAKDVVEYFLEA